MQEQENIWESYQIILQRLRNFVDAPYEAQPSSVGTEDESQLYAKLGENAGYGIDKMLVWERLTKGKVDFASDLVSSTITYWFGGEASGTFREGTEAGEIDRCEKDN